MDRSTFLNSLLAVAAAAPVASAMGGAAKQIGGISVPDTRLAREAAALARTALPVEIFNHSLRTYLFAELIAKAKKIDHDAEIVYVASILHDTGMSPKYMSDHQPFEVDGANVARKLLAKHAVSDVRASLAWDAVALHDNGGIASHKQPEVMLVNAGVGADFGGYLDLMSRRQIVRVLKAAPRTRFIDVFINATALVAKHKPEASAHSFVADVGYRRVPGFHLANFCDEVRDNPFAGYEGG
jgi:HD domain-containing protein